MAVLAGEGEIEDGCSSEEDQCDQALGENGEGEGDPSEERVEGGGEG